MPATAPATESARAAGARWWRTASLARRWAGLTSRMPVRMEPTLLNRASTVTSDRDQLPPARHRADRPCLRRTARSRPPGRGADRGIRPRGRRRRQGRRGTALAAVPAGRPGVRGAAPDGPGRLAGPGAQRLPGAAARPARYRPVLPREPPDAGAIR